MRAIPCQPLPRLALCIPVLTISGLTAITVFGAAQAIPRTLPLTKELAISGVEEDLGPIDRIAIAADGGVVVWQQQDRQLRFFDSRGRSLGRFGRSGEGPGEFRTLGPLSGWKSDTLWITDPTTRRVTLISPERTLVRSVKWPTAIRFGVDSVSLDPGLVPRAIFPDGSIIAPLFLRASTPRPLWYDTKERRTPYVTARPDGALVRVVGWSSELATRECIVEVNFKDGGGSAIGIPFCAMATAGVVSDGSRFVTVTPEPGNGIHLVAVTPAGDTLVDRRHRFPVHRIAKSVLDSTRRAMRNVPGLRYASAANTAKVVEAVNRITLPNTYPAFRRVLLGEDGSVWLEQWAADGTRLWVAVDRDGTILGRVQLPSRGELRAARRGTIWVVELDDDDVPSIVRYGVGLPR